MAPGTVAIGYMAKWTVANELASPEFCMPTINAIITEEKAGRDAAICCVCLGNSMVIMPSFPPTL